LAIFAYIYLYWRTNFVIFVAGTPLAGQIFDASNYVTAIEFSGAITVLASMMGLALRIKVGGYKPFAKV